MNVVMRCRKRCGNRCDGVILTCNGQRVISNTTDEVSQFPSNCTGCTTLPAGFFKPGMMLHIDLRGFINYNGTPQATQRIKLGGVTLVENVGNLPLILTSDSQTLFDFKLVCYSVGVTGQFIGSGRTSLLGGVGVVQSHQRALKMTAPVTLDTCQPMAFDVTYQWGTASADNYLTIPFAHVTYQEIG